MSLLDTLKTLDPTDDSLWTDDGLPALDAVKTITGDKKLTRQSVNDVALGLTRSNVTEYVAAPTPAVAEEVTIATEVIEEPVDTSYRAAILHYQESQRIQNELKQSKAKALRDAGFTVEDVLLAFPQLKRK
jgi:hypothetical protein